MQKNGTERNQKIRTHQRNPTQAKSVHIATSLKSKHKELQKKDTPTAARDPPKKKKNGNKKLYRYKFVNNSPTTKTANTSCWQDTKSMATEDGSGRRRKGWEWRLVCSRPKNFALKLLKVKHDKTMFPL